MDDSRLWNKELHLDVKDSVARIYAPEEFDRYTAGLVNPTVDELLDEPEVKTIIFDFGDNTFMDGSGVALLISTQTSANHYKKKVRLQNVGRAALRVLDLTGNTAAFEIVDAETDQ